MVNQEILGGLKIALERGYSLEKAMLTLFNSGYKREEIEEAAMDLLQSQQQAQLQQQGKPTQRPRPSLPQQPSAQKPMPSPQPTQAQRQMQPSQPMAYPRSQMPEQRPPQVPVLVPILPKQPLLQRPVQKVSGYGKPKADRSGKMIIIILISLLIFLVGLLGAIFFYRQQLIDYLNTLLT